MNKRAQFSIFQFIIFSLLVVLLFAGFIYAQGKLYDVFKEIGEDNEANVGNDNYVNLSQAADDIWGNAYTSIQSLRMVAFVYILALAIMIAITGFLQQKHPIMFFVYLMILVLAIIFAPTVSNAYESILEDNLFEGELANFSTANFLVLNLPTICLFIGVLSAIFLFINLIRSNQGEENFNIA